MNMIGYHIFKSNRIKNFVNYLVVFLLKMQKLRYGQGKVLGYKKFLGNITYSGILDPGNFALIRNQSQYCPEENGLACPVWPNDGNSRIPGYIKGDIIDYLVTVEGNLKAFYGKYSLQVSSSSSSPSASNSSRSQSRAPSRARPVRTSSFAKRIFRADLSEGTTPLAASHTSFRSSRICS